MSPLTTVTRVTVSHSISGGDGEALGSGPMNLSLKARGVRGGARAYSALLLPSACPSTLEGGAEPAQSHRLWNTETSTCAAEGGICPALGQQNETRGSPRAASSLSQHEALVILICPTFYHQSEVPIQATLHPARIYPKITYREVSVVPTAVSHRSQPPGKSPWNSGLCSRSVSYKEPCSAPDQFTAPQGSLAAGFIAECWAMLRG